jgi:hypothetical protein
MCSVVLTLTVHGFKGDFTATGILPAYPDPDGLMYKLAINGGTHQFVGAAGVVAVEWGFTEVVEVSVTIP